MTKEKIRKMHKIHERYLQSHKKISMKIIIEIKYIHVKLQNSCGYWYCQLFHAFLRYSWSTKIPFFCRHAVHFITDSQRSKYAVHEFYWAHILDDLIISPVYHLSQTQEESLRLACTSFVQYIWNDCTSILSLRYNVI